MATQRLVIDGYGQVELNNVAFRRNGRIEAQCAPDPKDFKNIPVENGMILAVDAANRVVKLPVDDSLPLALVYSAEHMYDERTPGLKSFKLNGTDDFYPRLGYFAVGDKWHTNTICYDNAEFASEAELLKALVDYKKTAIYGKSDATGAVALTKEKPASGLILKVIEYATMPDGQKAVKLQVFAC